jgi:hypothetical protein
MPPRLVFLCLVWSALFGCRKSDPASPPVAPATANASAIHGSPAPSVQSDSIRPDSTASESTELYPLAGTKEIPPSVYQYHEALAQARRAPGKVDLPALWALERQASDELISDLEGLSVDDFARAETLMTWHSLCRDEVVFVAAALDSFLGFSRRKGNVSDTTYFAFMNGAHTGTGIWRWDEMVTDYSACQNLGSPDLFASLRRIAAIRTGPPTPYGAWLEDPAEGLREHIKWGVCSCVDHDSTLRDFEKELASFPKDLPVRGLLDSLHDTLRVPRPKDRYNCQPG